MQTEKLQIRLSESEKAQFQTWCLLKGLTVSEALRACMASLVNNKPLPTQEYI